jgi:hypothetical protein
MIVRGRVGGRAGSGRVVPIMMLLTGVIAGAALTYQVTDADRAVIGSNATATAPDAATRGHDGGEPQSRVPAVPATRSSTAGKGWYLRQRAYLSERGTPGAGSTTPGEQYTSWFTRTE